MAVQQNQVPNDPTLRDLLDLLKKDVMLSLNCHALGTVQSFDTAKQTASASINYKKTYFQPDPVSGVYGPVLVDYPLLLDCPVVVLGGGKGGLTFPIAAGDECVVLFNDRDLDNWFQGGGSTAAVATPRLHSFSDGLILVGVRSLANVFASYSATAVEIFNGGNKLSVAPETGDITITVVGSHSLTVTFRAAGGVVIQNSIGNFTFADNADVTFNTGTVQGLFGSGGKVKFQNATGELVNALYTLFTTSTAGGFPLIPDPTSLATLASFKA